ncbi:transposase [Alteromonas macleodii]|uniref:transposase n=1 Tax=Alteromonas macleodii TaxID=28108 RepID=UPI003D2A2FCF
MLTLKSFVKRLFVRADQKGNSNQSVAAELGISAQQIYNWRRQFKRCGGHQFSTIQGVKFHQEDSDEVQALKRQLADLKEENAFLKKAAAYFASDQE